MNRIALVTGATRGVGRGIARALGAEGLTVYLTGRDEAGLAVVADEVRAAGGEARPIRCDHADDADVARLFARIREEEGRLDLLVNNAAAVHKAELSRTDPFWERSLVLNEMIDVGLRSNYVAAWHAAPLLLAAGPALLVNISFYGAVSYFCGPAYGAAKAGNDKMSYDMAVDFDSSDVTVVSFWPGFVRTEDLEAMDPAAMPEDMRALLPSFESPDFSGHVIAAMLRDPDRQSFSGRAVIGAEMARHYGISDEGRQPPDFTATMGKPVPFPYMG